MTRLPNLELLMYKASSIFLQEEEFLLKARKLKNYEILDIEVKHSLKHGGALAQDLTLQRMERLLSAVVR